jgi:hypothetical protein
MNSRQVVVAQSLGSRLLFLRLRVRIQSLFGKRRKEQKDEFIGLGTKYFEVGKASAYFERIVIILKSIFTLTDLMKRFWC